MAELSWIFRVFRSFWQISPFKIAIFAFACGFVPFGLAVQFSTVGDIAYYMPRDPRTVCDAAAIAAGHCIAKQVGYLHALNWWPTQMILLPFGLFFAFESIQNTKSVVEQMLASRMFARRDWSGPVIDIAPAIRQLWRTFFFIGVPLFFIIIVLFAKDWWCVVNWPIRLDVALGDVIGSSAHEALIPAPILDQLRGAGCYLKNAHENDWSVSSAFGSVRGLAPTALGFDKPSAEFLWLFSGYTYFVMALWSGILVAYFGFVIALAIVVYDLNRDRMEFQLVLDLNSSDVRNRRGFELLELVFRPCIYVTIVAFMMAFLMRIQNVYLRNREYDTIYDLLFADIPDTFGKFSGLGLLSLWEWFKDISGMLRRFLDFGQFNDPQSLLGAPAILLVLSLVTAVLAHILRGAAMGAQARVVAALHNQETAPQVANYYGLGSEEVVARANKVESWPLSWPELGYALRLMLSGIFCYIFYRIAFVWMGYVFARAIQGRFAERKKPS